MNNEKIEIYLKKINLFLESYINSKSVPENAVVDSVKYTLFEKCKRIRPLIMIGFYELCAGKDEEIYKFAAAIEMIHTYSLIHDDLPCMDNDKMRRGKKCNHLEFGEDIALLAGDALLTQAFEIISSGKFISAENTLKCINLLANSAGIEGMVFGQCIDLHNFENNFNKLIKIYELKTGKLFLAAAKIGVILAQGSNNELECAGRWAKNIGIAFQLIDDVLDEDINPNDLIDGVKVIDLIFGLISDSNRILKNCFRGDRSLLEEITKSISSYINLESD